MCNGADNQSYRRQHGNPPSDNLRRPVPNLLFTVSKFIRDPKPNRSLRHPRGAYNQINQKTVPDFT